MKCLVVCEDFALLLVMDQFNKDHKELGRLREQLASSVAKQLKDHEKADQEHDKAVQAERAKRGLDSKLSKLQRLFEQEQERSRGLEQGKAEEHTRAEHRAREDF